MSESIVIVSAARTPIGGMLGDFSPLAGWELGAVAIKAAVERAGVPGDSIDEALIGNCLMAGQGQAPARQAVRRAGLLRFSGGRRHAFSKMCGAGMRATMFAHDMLLAGTADVMLAGGMESMTNAPHLMFARKGVRYGAAQMFDHMALDGLEDAYDRGRADGRVRRVVRGQVRVHARGAGRVRDRLHPACQAGQRERRVRLGNGPRHAAGARAATRWSGSTSSRSRPSSTRSPRSSRPSRRTARSRPPTRVESISRTAPRRW